MEFFFRSVNWQLCAHTYAHRMLSCLPFCAFYIPSTSTTYYTLLQQHHYTNVTGSIVNVCEFKVVNVYFLYVHIIYFSQQQQQNTCHTCLQTAIDFRVTSQCISSSSCLHTPHITYFDGSCSAMRFLFVCRVFAVMVVVGWRRRRPGSVYALWGGGMEVVAAQRPPYIVVM